MADNHTYKVKNPSVLYTMSVCMVCVLGGMGLLCLVLEKKFQIGLLVCLAIVLLPFALLAVWARRYTICVKGSTITVQKAFRLKPCSIDMADITKAVYIVSETRMGVNTKLTVHSDLCGTFTVETLMTNSKKLQKQIESCVSRDKIQVIHKTFVKK